MRVLSSLFNFAVFVFIPVFPFVTDRCFVGIYVYAPFGVYVDTIDR